MGGFRSIFLKVFDPLVDSPTSKVILFADYNLTPFTASVYVYVPISWRDALQTLILLTFPERWPSWKSLRGSQRATRRIRLHVHHFDQVNFDFWFLQRGQVTAVIWLLDPIWPWISVIFLLQERWEQPVHIFKVFLFRFSPAYKLLSLISRFFDLAVVEVLPSEELNSRWLWSLVERISYRIGETANIEVGLLFWCWVPGYIFNFPTGAFK
jgi:hypothetical protein